MTDAVSGMFVCQIEGKFRLIAEIKSSDGGLPMTPEFLGNIFSACQCEWILAGFTIHSCSPLPMMETQKTGPYHRAIVDRKTLLAGVVVSSGPDWSNWIKQ